MQYKFSEATKTTDENGVVKLGVNDVMKSFMVARDGRGHVAYMGYDALGYPNVYESQPRQSRIFTITDRPVYRPAR